MKLNKEDKQVIRFFLIVLVSSFPFYALNLLNINLAFNLPISALMVLVPTITAFYLTGFKDKELFNVLDFNKIKKGQIKYLVLSFLIVPFYLITSLFIMQKHNELPSYNLIMIFFGFIFFFIGAIFEEIGWVNYASKKMIDNKHSVLFTGLSIGLVWQLWHLVPFLMLGKSLDWIFFHFLSGIGYRLIMTYIFVNTNKTIFPAIILHTMLNLVPELLPGAYQSYNPMIVGILIWVSIIFFFKFHNFKR